MRDYKNVKVPKKYRTASTRVSVKRVEVSRGARKQAKGRLKRSVLNILAFAVVAGCCWLGWRGYLVITHAEMFQVSGVDVKGVRQLGDRDLKKILGPFTGQNIFRIDLDGAVRRARANTWIRDVRIQRSLPNRITMSIIERVPYAVLDTGPGRYLMDNEGVVIDRAAKEAPGSLPIVAMKDCRAIPGEPVMSESMTEALTLLAEIEARGGWKLGDVTIRAVSREALSVVYADHEFKIGSGKYAEKLRRLAEVIADVQQRGLSFAYVDLRAEHQAAVMVSK